MQVCFILISWPSSEEHRVQGPAVPQLHWVSPRCGPGPQPGARQTQGQGPQRQWVTAALLHHRSHCLESWGLCEHSWWFGFAFYFICCVSNGLWLWQWPWHSQHDIYCLMLESCWFCAHKSQVKFRFLCLRSIRWFPHKTNVKVILLSAAEWTCVGSGSGFKISVCVCVCFSAVLGKQDTTETSTRQMKVLVHLCVCVYVCVWVYTCVCVCGGGGGGYVYIVCTCVICADMY